MTTEHTVVRSGKSKRKAFNSVADYLLIIAIVAHGRAAQSPSLRMCSGALPLQLLQLRRA
jgi:hypothetical protein